MDPKAIVESLILTIGNELKKAAPEFSSGILSSIKAISTCAKTPNLVSVYKTMAKYMIVIAIVVYILGLLVSLPFQVLLFILGIFIDTKGVRGKITDLRKGFGNTIVFTTMPLLISIGLRYCFTQKMEDAFFAVLDNVDEEYSQKLKAQSQKPWLESLKIEIIRFFKGLSYLPIYWILSMIPGISLILKLAYQIYVYNKWFNDYIAIFLGVFSIIPIAENGALKFTQIFFTQVYLLKSLLSPYFSRTKLSSDEERKFLAGHSFWILGFMLPFSYMISIPYVGPTLWLVAQGGVAVGLVEINRMRKAKSGETVASKSE